jgi:hypothetical protein
MERILTGQFAKDWIIWATGANFFAIPWFIYMEKTYKGGVDAAMYTPDYSNPDLLALFK